MPELIDGTVRDGQHALGRNRAFGHDHDRKVLAALGPVAEPIAHLVDVERPLGNEDDVGTAGETTVKRDPSCVTTHHLHHHDAVVRFRGGMEPVDCVGGGLHRGIEAERHLGGREIVVDGLGNSDEADTFSAEPMGHTECVLTADRDDRVEVFGLHGGQHAGDPVVGVERVRPRRSEDRAAPRQEATYRVEIEVDHITLDDTAPPVPESDDGVPVLRDALAYDRADHGVQSGAVAPTGQDPNAHVASLLLVRSVVEKRVLGRDAPELLTSSSRLVRSVVEKRVLGRDATELRCGSDSMARRVLVRRYCARP